MVTENVRRRAVPGVPQIKRVCDEFSIAMLNSAMNIQGLLLESLSDSSVSTESD